VHTSASPKPRLPHFVTAYAHIGPSGPLSDITRQSQFGGEYNREANKDKPVEFFCGDAHEQTVAEPRSETIYFIVKPYFQGRSDPRRAAWPRSFGRCAARVSASAGAWPRLLRITRVTGLQAGSRCR